MIDLIDANNDSSRKEFMEYIGKLKKTGKSIILNDNGKPFAIMMRIDKLQKNLPPCKFATELDNLILRCEIEGKEKNLEKANEQRR